MGHELSHTNTCKSLLPAFYGNYIRKSSAIKNGTTNKEYTLDLNQATAAQWRTVAKEELY